VLLLLGAILTAVWVGCDWPPPRLILKYGLPSVADGSEIEQLEIAGVSFRRLPRGYVRFRRSIAQSKGDLLGRLSQSLGLPWGSERKPSGWAADLWVELPEDLWITPHRVSPSDLAGTTWTSIQSRVIDATRSEKSILVALVDCMLEDLQRKRKGRFSIAQWEELAYASEIEALHPADYDIIGEGVLGERIAFAARVLLVGPEWKEKPMTEDEALALFLANRHASGFWIVWRPES
jgi:hypothetical protein